MKKATIYLMIYMISVSILPTSVFATEKNPTTSSNPPKEVPREVQVMFDRLKEIKSMNKSDMDRAEKKELRKEVRAINKSLATTNNGVYISVGALLVIIILILIL
jgi:hypothetical protein